MSKWRDKYKVHPAADVFPMMSDEELAKLGADIKANGLKSMVAFFLRGHGDTLTLADGRNRLEAMERAGVKFEEMNADHLTNLSEEEKVAYIISKNIHRRHLTKQQQADLIVAAVKAGETSRQVGGVTKRHVKGKRGSEKDAVKEAAVKAGAEHGIGKRTIERSIAKAEGKTPKPKAKPSGVVDDPADEASDQDSRLLLTAILASHPDPAIAASIAWEYRGNFPPDFIIGDRVHKHRIWLDGFMAAFNRASTLPQDRSAEPKPDEDEAQLDAMIALWNAASTKAQWTFMQCMSIEALRSHYARKVASLEGDGEIKNEQQHFKALLLYFASDGQIDLEECIKRTTENGASTLPADGSNEVLDVDHKAAAADEIKARLSAGRRA